jgi:hypothetical protein
VPRVSGHTFSVEDAIRVAEAAGLDVSRPLADQANGQPDLAGQLAELSEKIDRLAEAQAPPAGQHPVSHAEAQAQGLAQQLDRAQSTWFSFDGGVSDGE